MHGAFSATAERLLQYADRQVVHRRNCCRCITVIVSPTLTTLRQVLDHTLHARQRNNRLQLVKLQAVGSRPRHTNNNLVISCLIFSCLQAMCSWAKKNNNNNNNNNFTSFHGPVHMLELSLLLLRWQRPWCHGAKHQSGVCLPHVCAAGQCTFRPSTYAARRLIIYRLGCHLEFYSYTRLSQRASIWKLLLRI